MGRINRANLKKTIYYMKRNGICRTWYAVLERLEERKKPPYVWTPPTEAELDAQRRGWEQKGLTATFSILVPAYRTRPEYLKELLESLRCQTYPRWELILADATEDGSVERALRDSIGDGRVEKVLRDSEEPGMADSGQGDRGTEERAQGGMGTEAPGQRAGGLDDFGTGPRILKTDVPPGRDPEETSEDVGFPGFSNQRIRYIRLEQNRGIAGNTNQALPYAAGDYIGLLDHDDVLTPDALYEMAAAIRQAEEKGMEPAFLYSDEDKCNGGRTEYFEPNRKEGFNLDLLLSNNYICHFLVMKRELMQELKFRPEYDGAQDFDLVLRAVAGLEGREQSVIHIPKVLYHWRCHPGSTAENPESKRHAYDAGRRAVQDFADRKGWHARAVETAHVGFYALRYEGDLFDSRTDIGAVGGRVVGRGRVRDGREVGGRPVRGGRIVGGRMTRDGQVLYEGLPANYSGYLHRAALMQDAEAVDLRSIRIRPECRETFRQITGIAYRTVPGTDIFDVSALPEEGDIVGLSLRLCEALRKEGYRILYLPDMEGSVK